MILEKARVMKKVAGEILAYLANIVFYLRGYRFPEYMRPRHRIELLLYGNEQDVSRFMKNRLMPGMCVMDVGANVGLITRICAEKVGRTGRVFAFEPDPHTRKFLDYNVKRCPNVIVSPIALSNENAKARFHLHPQSGTSNSLVPFDGPNEVLEVDCRTIDSFLSENPQFSPNCIKIDVEGAELKVLEGMLATIESVPDLMVVIEFCPENLVNGGCELDSYYCFLENSGFFIEMIEADGSTTPVESLSDLMSKLSGKVYCNLFCRRRNPVSC